MLGSNPYVCRSYGGKTDSGAFLPGGPNLFKTHKGEIYLIGKNFVEETFLSPSQYFVTFRRRKLFPQIK